jgi:hypothetical protein
MLLCPQYFCSNTVLTKTLLNLSLITNLNPCWRTFAVFALVVSVNSSFAQSISGVIIDENNRAVPHANVFIREIEMGVSADQQGKYFLTIDPGAYTVVVSSVGFETRTFQIIVKDKAFVKDFQINSSSVELGQIEIKVKRRDPAYEIIRNVIDNKEKFLTQVKSSRTNVYVRASETVDEKEKKRREQVQKQEEPDELSDKTGPIDPLAAERKKEALRLSKINLIEMQLVLNYQYPDRYKEERTAYKSYGQRDGLFVPLFDRTDFNFYNNLVDLKGIAEIPLISPVSKTAILSYKYKLEEVLKEDGNVVYKIKVTPRKIGDATCRGYLFINDSTWNINRLELTVHKGALKFYDDFTIRQTYKEIEKDFWIPFRQEFDYQTKAGPRLFKGNTVLVYSNFEKEYTFPEKFFGNEVSVITKEAYKRDSTYWNKERPEALTEDQRKVIRYRDSIEAVVTSKKYLDSMQAKYNKVTIGEVLYHGLGFRNEAKKNHIYISPVLGLLDFAVVGGFRFGPHVNYFKRYEDNRWISTGGSVNVGVKNVDAQGSAWFGMRYNPFSQGQFNVGFGREFQSINSFDAYLNQLKISNYIVRDHVDLYHRIELVNGFFVQADVSISDRRSLLDYQTRSILNEIIDEVDPIEFEGYQAFISNVRLSYTLKQKYMREPNQKVILGSKYPTIFFNHRKGWQSILGSDVNFDYIDFGLDHTLQLGTIGNSRYTITAGKFVNTRDLRYVDWKRFRQSDPYLYSDPMHSFQLLDTALNTTNWFIEAHYIHHFNGAMINNIPLIKKLRLRTVAGAGFMWIKENNYRYEEIFAGLEKVIKLGARRRLKLGVYGVIAQSNFLPPTADWKISFDIIDTWKRNWSY